jgi:hypothetical protein
MSFCCSLFDHPVAGSLNGALAWESLPDQNYNIAPGRLIGVAKQTMTQPIAAII